MNMLKARLYEFELQKKKKKMQILKIQNLKLAWDIRLDRMFYIHID